MKKNWKYSIFVKLLCWLVLIVMACSTALLGIGIKIIKADNFYNHSFDEAEINVMLNEAGGYQDAVQIISEAVYGTYDPESDKANIKNAYFQVIDDDGTVLLDEKAPASKLIKFDMQHMIFRGTEGSSRTHIYTANVSIDASFPYHDRYELWHQVTKMLYTMQYSIYYAAAAAFVIGFLAFVLLIRSAGHTTKDHEIHTGWLYRIPGDLYVIGWLGLTFIVALMFSEIGNPMASSLSGTIYYIGTIFIFCGCMIAECILNIAVRIKKGGFWKHTFLAWIMRNCVSIFQRLGLRSQTIWILLALFLMDLISIVFYADGHLFFLWFFRTVLIFILGIWAADMLTKLQRGTEKLAAGDLSYQVDTAKMKGHFKQAGENLNHISAGMSKAVDDRMKSERMKTELITNVSHDIKTPLTSIINYSDLISRESCDNPKIKEYSDVLTRQSERLKKLIEDLIEASKASTGNLEVLLSPCEVNVLLSQAVGEYEEKFKQKELETVIDQPDHPVMIMADGRRMWRVFDNLMNNICKYSQTGTRVYLDLSEKDGFAEIIFKNTSKEALNISADELKERFVRGDSSRNTEGNGLGLSIAQSLTELQKGTMDLHIDGDLFKVILRFPVLEN